jgi:hypothetical protein
VQTFGDFINFNPHLHIIASDGCFATDGGFMVGTEPDASSLIDLFRGEVFKMLKKAGKIDDNSLKIMSGQCRLKLSIRKGHFMRIDSAGL